MNLNFTNPSGLLNPKTKKILQDALVNGTLTRHPGFSDYYLPPQQGPAIDNPEQVLPIDNPVWIDLEDIEAGRGLPLFEKPSLGVDRRQAMALVYTFGGPVGGSLINTIEIVEGSEVTDNKTRFLPSPTHNVEKLASLADFIREGSKVTDNKTQILPSPTHNSEKLAGLTNFVREDSKVTDNKTQILLPPTHNSEKLVDLVDFIGKAARIWQLRTGRHTEAGTKEDYNFAELTSLNLTSRQHLKAVQDWFRVSYYFDYCRTRKDPYHMAWDDAVEPIAKVMGFSLNSTSTTVLAYVGRQYAGLIEEIRDPSKLSRNRSQR